LSLISRSHRGPTELSRPLTKLRRNEAEGARSFGPSAQRTLNASMPREATIAASSGAAQRRSMGKTDSSTGPRGSEARSGWRKCSMSHAHKRLMRNSCYTHAAFVTVATIRFGLDISSALSRRRWVLSMQMSIGHFRAQNLSRAVAIHEQKQWSSTVPRRANWQYRI
jgi:hypothetical protein